MTKKIGLISGLLLTGVIFVACQPQQEPQTLEETAPVMEDTTPAIQYEEQFDTDPPMATPTMEDDTMMEEDTTPTSTPMTEPAQ